MAPLSRPNNRNIAALFSTPRVLFSLSARMPPERPTGSAQAAAFPPRGGQRARRDDSGPSTKALRHATCPQCASGSRLCWGPKGAKPRRCGRLIGPLFSCRASLLTVRLASRADTHRQWGDCATRHPVTRQQYLWTPALAGREAPAKRGTIPRPRGLPSTLEDRCASHIGPATRPLDAAGPRVPYTAWCAARRTGAGWWGQRQLAAWSEIGEIVLDKRRAPNDAETTADALASYA